MTLQQFGSKLARYLKKTIKNIREKRRIKKELEIWINNGRPTPPPHIVKQLAIAELQKIFGYSILVETGTYLGEMVEAQKKRFKTIISIELGVELFEKARDKFKDDDNIHIFQGDSGKVLPKILTDIHEPAIFWLDGHYSAGITSKGDKECPIFEELDAIFKGNKFNHVILIDDARCFTGEGDYPTFEQLVNYIRAKNEKYGFEIKDDIIRCVVQ